MINDQLMDQLDYIVLYLNNVFYEHYFVEMFF